MELLQLEPSKQLDQDAFILLYKKYYQELFNKFFFILNSKEIVEDILQEVFLKIWLQREKVNVDAFSLKTYLFRIGHNLIVDYYRHNKVEKRYRKKYAIQATLNAIDEDRLFQEDDLSRLDRVINKLPPKRKKVYKLCKLAGKSYGEVSALLEVSHYTISDHIVKANQFIKSEFRKQCV